MTEVSLGLGSRVDILKANMSNYHKLLLTRLLHQVFVVVALGLVKVSVCLFLLRLVMKKLYIRALWGIIIFIVVFTIGSVLSIVSKIFYRLCDSMAYYRPSIFFLNMTGILDSPVCSHLSRMELFFASTATRCWQRKVLQPRHVS